MIVRIPLLSTIDFYGRRVGALAEQDLFAMAKCDWPGLRRLARLELARRARLES